MNRRNKILKNRNYIIYGQDNLSFININKNKKVNIKKYSIGDISSIPGKKKGLRNGKFVILIPTKDLFMESFIIPAQASDKIEEVLQFKFLTALPLAKSELSLSYYLDRNIIKDKILVLAFAIKKEILQEKYKQLIEYSIKLRGIFPLPLLTYNLLRRNAAESIKEICDEIYDENSLEKTALLSVDCFFDNIILTVFTPKGVYIRQGNKNNLIEEVEKIEKYILNELQVNHIEVSYQGKRKKIKNFKEEWQSIVKNKSVCNQDNSGSDQRKISDCLSSYPGRLSFSKKELKRSDFLREISEEQKKKSKKSKYAIIILLILISVLNFYTLTLYKENSSKHLLKYQEELTLITPYLQDIEKLERELSFKEKKLSLYQNLYRNNNSYLPWLYGISTTIPEESRISQMNFREDKLLLLEGEVDSALDLMENLQGSDYFSRLEFVGGIMIEEQGERFRITGDLNDDY